jgi:Histidine kinase
MTIATFMASTDAPHASGPRRFLASRVGYGLLLGASIALLEFAYYYPLVSTPDTRGVFLLLSLLISWCGEGVLLAATVALFELRHSPRPLGVRQLALAATVGAIGGVLAWQLVVHWVLREHFGMWVMRDFVGQPVDMASIALYHVWLMLLFGGLAAAVYSSRQRHARMLTIVRAAELSRETSQRHLADAKLAALQARIDPEFVFQTLTRLEQLYEADPPGADRLLEDLIVFLRAALADIRVAGAATVLPLAADEYIQ